MKSSACSKRFSRPHSWGGWTRTTNFLINSQAVCQLTYAPREKRNYVPTAICSLLVADSEQTANSEEQ
jgi:hypothetical protein